MSECLGTTVFGCLHGVFSKINFSCASAPNVTKINRRCVNEVRMRRRLQGPKKLRAIYTGTNGILVRPAGETCRLNTVVGRSTQNRISAINLFKREHECQLML